MALLQAELESILGHESEIKSNALRLRLLRLNESYNALWYSHRQQMGPEIQIGLLKEDYGCFPGRGYVFRTPTSPTDAGGGFEKGEKTDLPSNLQEAVGGLRNTLLDLLKEGYVSATVDVTKLKIYVANNVINLPTQRGKLPKGSVLLQGDWAIFRRCGTSDGTEVYELDALWINSSGIDSGELKLLTGAAVALFVHSELELTYKKRKDMKNWGYRWSPQVDEDGQTINLHCVNGKVVVAEEATAACVMTKIVEKIVQPSLSMYLLNLIGATLEAGGNLWNTKYPYTVNTMSVDYENEDHTEGANRKVKRKMRILTTKRSFRSLVDLDNWKP